MKKKPLHLEIHSDDKGNYSRRFFCDKGHTSLWSPVEINASKPSNDMVDCCCPGCMPTCGACK